MDNQRLFNCCTDCAPPDWRAFKSLAISGCKNDLDSNDGSTWTVQCPDDEAEFWTVYAIGKEPGDTIALTDCKTRREALDAMFDISFISRLTYKLRSAQGE